MTALDGPDDDVARAVVALRAGDLVAFPTETVYGLGADAANPDAVRRLYAVKGRPADHPVIVHLAHAAQLDELAREVPDAARRLANACWPGPLTIVVRRDPERVAAALTGGRDTVGLRVPDHPLALRLLEAFGGGLAAPSANRFGRVSPTTAAHVLADLGADVEVVLDGGTCRIGVESTIVDVTGREPAILRVGGTSRADIELAIGRKCVLRTTGVVAAPGTLASHYAPRAAVEVVAGETVAQRANELIADERRTGVLAFGPLGPLGPELPEQLVVLDAPRNADEYARVLYARLREADELELDVLLVVSPTSSDGLGAAVADRVRRAAH
ncbi:MAG: L-threonylcarbamoyladenylate synthase [Acidimicrobiia bacterium]